MAFGIEGQYKMTVSIGDFDDFLTDDKFISFKMVENIGLSLPMWELNFDCVFPEMLKYFNETQVLNVQLGTTTQDLEPLTFAIKVPMITPQSASSYSVILRGFTNNVPYLEQENIQAYPDNTSKQLMQAAAGKYGWTFKSNMSETQDKMTYLQSGICDYKFLFNEWMHSYYKDNDIIIPAISTKGILSYNSLSDLIANVDPEKILTFTDSKAEDKEIVVSANSNSGSNSALTNSFGNYMKQRDIFDISTGVLTHVDVSNAIPIISESKTTTTSDISKSSGYYVQNVNVHKNYYKQELINTQKFMSIQASNQWISAADTIIKDLYPGDLCMFMTKKNNGQINDQTSGLYLVNRRVISIKERQVHTNLLLSRENMNYSK